MRCLIIMQGDDCYITFKLKKNGEPLDINDVSRIQFVIGDLVKYYGTEEGDSVEYNEDTGLFYFPLTQQESFELEGSQFVQIRIKNLEGRIRGIKLGRLPIQYGYKEEEM